MSRLLNAGYFSFSKSCAAKYIFNYKSESIDKTFLLSNKNGWTRHVDKQLVMGCAHYLYLPL